MTCHYSLEERDQGFHVHVKNAKTFQSSRTVQMKNSRDHKTEPLQAFFRPDATPI